MLDVSRRVTVFARVCPRIPPRHLGWRGAPEAERDALGHDRAFQSAGRVAMPAPAHRAELTAQLCSESPALQAAAEECMAAHSPPPLEMAERVLLSPDLMPFILGQLLAEDAAVAAVCSHWLAVWEATKLRQVPLDFPVDAIRAGTHVANQYEELGMAATPDGRLQVSAGTRLFTLDRSMRVLQMRELGGVRPHPILAAIDDSTVIIGENNGNFVEVLHHGRYCDIPWRTVFRFPYDGTASYGCTASADGLGEDVVGESYRHNVCGPVLVPGGPACPPSERLDEIFALDAQTLQLRYRFGQGLLDHPCGMAVVGDELYVCDRGNDRLQVFTLTGEHRRSVTGAWRKPNRLCFAKGRLYLVERTAYGTVYPPYVGTYETVYANDMTNDEDVGAINFAQGRRLLVLSLQGKILQVFKHPTEPTVEFKSICCFDNKLLVSYSNIRYRTSAAGPRTQKKKEECGMLALQTALPL